MVRIVENKDWIIYTLLGISFLYVFMFRILLREISVVKFYTLKEEFVSNRFQTWVISSLGLSIVMSLAFSQFMPIIPKIFGSCAPFGYQLNKFGVFWICMVALFSVRSVFTLLFFLSIGEVKIWGSFYYVAAKYYFALSLVLMILVLVQNFLLPDGSDMLYPYVVVFGFSFVLKNLIYLFNNLQILPSEWYYKILYICALQILPILVLWKFLFL
ncbi:DUF4271 domain-containing protein [Riemerella columbipharyngis]|uniref:DUF4271 domain-containing protein n=1 Tax=Riemerella columbipharyngis TaxID=1071918 RepID=A0A1G7DY55_9FLAO|nr:DUF4271 domain-containing protein [Riemerella columbipharyngis]SDE56322.1 protein of unknown function [Riemerella columbipharyngis]